MTADIGELPDLDFDIEAELNAGEDVPMCGVTEGSNLQPTATATYGSCSSIGSMRANPFPQAHTGSASTQIAGTSSISRTITRFDGGHPMTSTLRPWTNTANSGFGTTTMPKHGAAPERRFVQQVVSSPEHHLYGRVLGADGYSEESPPNISACSLGSVSSCVRSPTGTSPDSSGYASGGSGGGCQRSLPSPENAASKNAGPYLPDSVRQYALQDRSPMGKPMPPSSATHLQGMTPRPGMVHPRRAIIQHPVNIQQPALHRAPQVLGNHSLGSQSQKVSSEVGPVKRLLTPRHPPNVLFAYSLDYRICEINRRLLNMKRSGAAGIAQWIAFTDEYFEPGAFLGISFCLENGLNQFKVPRNLIPQFFMTYLESVAELQFLLNNIKVVSVNSLSHSVLVDCPNGNVTTVLPLEEPGTTPTLPHQGRKINNDFTAMVRMDCRFSIEFGSQSQQFKSFSFAVRNHQELIPRQIARDFGVEACQSSLTRGGLPNNLISFLRMSHILSPMQELMTRQKQTGLPPQETLRHAVFERTQQIAQRQPNGRPSPPTIDMPQVIDRIAESGFQKPVAKQRRRRKQTENPAGVQAKKANRRGSQQLQTYEA